MHKILCMILTFAMLLCLLAACGNTDVPNITEVTEVTESTPSETEAIEQGDIAILYTNDGGQVLRN